MLEIGQWPKETKVPSLIEPTLQPGLTDKKHRCGMSRGDGCYGERESKGQGVLVWEKGLLEKAREAFAKKMHEEHLVDMWRKKVPGLSLIHI